MFVRQGAHTRYMCAGLGVNAVFPAFYGDRLKRAIQIRMIAESQISERDQPIPLKNDHIKKIKNQFQGTGVAGEGRRGSTTRRIV